HHLLCNPPTTPNIYTLSLHDALPIFRAERLAQGKGKLGGERAIVDNQRQVALANRPIREDCADGIAQPVAECWHVTLSAQAARRSEEHTSELQSPYDLVCRLLLEKKK